MNGEMLGSGEMTDDKITPAGREYQESEPVLTVS